MRPFPHRLHALAAAALALFLPLVAPAAHAGTGGADRPNVVLFVVDDLGLQVGAYGDPDAVTPAMDRLAAEGARFERAYCTTSSCSASRAVLLTGMHNHATGHYGHSHTVGHFSTYDSVQSVSRILGGAGYRTGAFGKLHVAPDLVYPFDAQDSGKGNPGGDRNTVALADAAADWALGDGEKPFFLLYALMDAHQEGSGRFGNPAEGESYPGVENLTFDPAAVTLPPWVQDAPHVRRKWAHYLQAIHRADQGLARLVQRLEAAGQLNNTLIIATSDNGPPFHGSKATLYESGVHLPLIVRMPDSAGAPAGVVSDGLVTFVDVTPTILDVCGVPMPVVKPVQPWESGKTPWPDLPPRPYEMHGRSFADLARGEAGEGRDHAFLSHTFHQVNMYDPMRALVERRWKYVFNLNPQHEQEWVVASVNPGKPLETQRQGVRRILDFTDRTAHQLFDLEADPWETRNLAHEPAHAGRVRAMHDRVARFMHDTADPWVFVSDQLPQRAALDPEVWALPEPADAAP